MQAAQRNTFFWASAVFGLASLRLAHIHLLWSDEDYHLATSIQLLAGRLPYRDFWYDKPPLAAFFYTLIAGHSGWPLRVLDLFFVLACCFVAYKLAAAWWGKNEGHAAAFLLAFFTTFYLPSATIPFAVDGLLLLPHLAAIYFASTKRSFWCGVCCALGLLTNIKGVFVAATCVLWLFPQGIALFLSGLALPLAACAVIGAQTGILAPAYRQIWLWGAGYAQGAPLSNAWATDLKRILDWLAFHAVLPVAAILAFRQMPKAEVFRLGTWLLLSALPLTLGNHFAPRYFFQVLPVLVILAARGLRQWHADQPRLCASVVAVLLAVPLVRFGPHYFQLMTLNLEGKQTHWSDAALDVDSQNVADFLNRNKHSGTTLFVWGYRPDIYVYTRLLSPSQFWDSQPLDGVPADRHLSSNRPILSASAQTNRGTLVQTHPDYIVDGLGLLNPALAPAQFPEVARWLSGYSLVYQTKLSRIYQRR